MDVDLIHPVLTGLVHINLLTMVHTLCASSVTQPLGHNLTVSLMGSNVPVQDTHTPAYE